jgi:hypothetical protein
MDIFTMFVFVLNTSWYWSLQYLYSYKWIQFMNLDIFIFISVAWDVVGPSVNTFRAQLIFPFQTQCLLFFWIFSNKIHSSISSTHLSSENSEINSIKFDSPWAFQQHQERLQIPVKFSVLILVSFHWKNDSTIVASTP